MVRTSRQEDTALSLSATSPKRRRTGSGESSSLSVYVSDQVSLGPGSPESGFEEPIAWSSKTDEEVLETLKILMQEVASRKGSNEGRKIVAGMMATKNI